MPTPLAPEVDVAAALIEAGQATTLGTDIKYGPPESDELPGNGAVVLWVTCTGGPPPIPMLPASSQGAIYEYSVQVRVWTTAADDKAAARAKARAVRDALNFKTPNGLASLASYMSCRAIESDPFYLGVLPSGRHELSVNFSLLARYVN